MLIPIACARAKPSTTLVSAPLCSATPTGPAVSGRGTFRPNGAAPAVALRKPRQFGPSRVIPAAAAWATSFSSSAMPSAPTSR